MSITSLNLTLSAVCGARCVYCPRPRSRKAEQAFMTSALVERVLEESAGYPISSIEAGENGDSFLNPAAIPILRLLRSASQAEIRMFTNFANFTPRKIDAVMAEGLLDTVVANIDGADQEAYGAVKGLDLESVEANIRYFLDRNNRLKKPVSFTMQSLTISHYTKTVQRVLGRPPLHLPREWLDKNDDFDEIVKKWEAQGVTPRRSVVTLWAEGASDNERKARLGEALLRGKSRLFPKPCRMLQRIRESLFILPSGEVYLCCADFNFELIVGDLQNQTAQEIVEGARRREMIENLSQRKFSKIGGPCMRPELCRIY